MNKATELGLIVILGSAFFTVEDVVSCHVMVAGLHERLLDAINEYDTAESEASEDEERTP